MDDALPWPLITIDFEASSLDEGTYPIEVGVCRWTAADQPIEGWSALLVPIPAWREHGSWSAASQEIHGIHREELEHGLSPTDAIVALNAITGGHPAFCDGGGHDFHWARMMARASGVRPTWPIGDFDHVGTLLDPPGYARMVAWLDRAAPRHRARDDAERLMKALARGLSVEDLDSVDLTI